MGVSQLPVRLAGCPASRLVPGHATRRPSSADQPSAHLAAQLAIKNGELTKAHEQLAAALSRIEISSAAAVGEAQKIMSEKINEAYKEGQRDAQRFLKEMRSFFP